MSIYRDIAIILFLTATMAIVNRRWFKLHSSIGLLVGGLIFAGLSLLMQHLHIGRSGLARIIATLSFDDFVLDFLLGFMLFAGAIHLKRADLMGRKWQIGVFALMGVLGTTAIVGLGLWLLGGWLGVGLGLVPCLMFGALISPTDPIAVLAIIQKLGAPKPIITDVCGESLFNDGIGVVMFTTLLVAYGGGDVTFAMIGGRFLLAAVGGLLLGVLYGEIAKRIIRSNTSAEVSILTSLAVASAGFSLANALQCSGAISMVVAGVVVGNDIKKYDSESRLELDVFWRIVDEIGNAIVFFILGLELLVVEGSLRSWRPMLFSLAGLTIVLTLLGRLLSVGLPVRLLRRVLPFHHGELGILVWGGLRGALPLAMALSLPKDMPERSSLLLITYAVVGFSILVQGTTVRRLVPGTLDTGGGS